MKFWYKLIKLVYEDGTPKGALQQRDINASHLILDDMKIILQQHEDFHNEKSAVEHFLEKRGHIYFSTLPAHIVSRIAG